MSAVTVGQSMKSCPLVVPFDAFLMKAAQIMIMHKIRHLPVLNHGRLVGLLNDRIVKQAMRLPGRESLCVSDIMIPDPIVTRETALVSQIATQMAENREDCAVVVDASGAVTGIFTTTDGMRLLHRVLDDDDFESGLS